MSSSAQQNHNQKHQQQQDVNSSSDGDSRSLVPAAPYPPMQHSSLRSSLSSNPLYGSRFLTTTTTTTEGTDAMLTVDSANTTSPTTSIPSQHQQGSPPFSNQNYIKRFVSIRTSPINVGLYASINLHEEDLRTRSKVGPRLCEIHQLKKRNWNNGDTQHEQWQMWKSHSVGVSRASPQLGPSITSTCLDWSPTNSFRLATGLSTGNLCVHSLKQVAHGEEEETILPFSVTNEQFSFGRNKRAATSVAWRPGSNSNHVALGLSMMTSTAQHYKHPHHRKSRTNTEFGCLLWDIQHQQSSSSASAISKTTGSTPLHKICHNTGVSALAWCSPMTLLVGCQGSRHLQLYDLRASATSSTPITIRNAHREGAVQIIRVNNDHDGNSYLLATMGIADPVVKLWDMRKIDSAVTSDMSSSENLSSPSESYNKTNPSAVAEFEMEYPPTTIDWVRPGVLSVAIQNRVIHFESKTSNKQPLQLGQSYSCVRNDDIIDMAMVPNEERFLVALKSKKVYDLSKHTTAPLAISQRDGHIVHGFGEKIWKSTTTFLKSNTHDIVDNDDISVIMKQRACQEKNQDKYYSMNPVVNMQILTSNTGIKYNNASIRALIQTWKWIARMQFENVLNLSPSRALVEGGVWQLLGIEIRTMDQQHPSASPEGGRSNIVDEDFITIEGDCLAINMYDSSSRRCALLACGWQTQYGNAYKFDTSSDTSTNNDAGNEDYERAAALAVWHDNIGVAVDILQQGAKQRSSSDMETHDSNQLLQLVAICIAGYNGSNAAIWQHACSNLLEQTKTIKNVSADHEKDTSIAYLRALLRFLLLTKKEVDDSKVNNGLKSVLEDAQLSLSDRIAFACRFLNPVDLKSQLKYWTNSCQEDGTVEGLIITGLTTEGIRLLQSFVDKTGDVQTATLITSRAVIDVYSKDERRICSEWLDSYRSILNYWQMWQARAMFDVDRADLMRAFASSSGTAARQQPYNKVNKLPTVQKKSQSTLEPDSVLSSIIPAQMEARCNYCSVSLSGVARRQQDGISSNEWLSRSKNVLSCCPKCRKPLPRCAICLLSLGCLNPYAELKKSAASTSCHIIGNSTSNRGSGGQFNKNNDFVSSLANLPLAEWFTWCMKCKHGGHAHHLVEWFSEHNTCPVSGCDCQCQFDGNIQNQDLY